MTPFAFLLAAGRIAGAALACGISLYASLAVAGIAARLGLTSLPPGLSGLEQWLLIGAAIALFAVEVIAFAMPWIGAIWEALNTLVRPLAATLLLFVALEPLPAVGRVAAAIGGGVLAVAAQSARVGLQLTAARAARAAGRVPLRIAEVLVASALIIGSLRLPGLATGLTAVILGFLALAGPRLWRASEFAATASIALVRAFFEPRHWRTVDDLPRRLRALVPPPEVGLPEIRTTRASLSGPARHWRNGWLFTDGRSVVFLESSRVRVARIRLPRVADAGIQRGLLADSIAIPAEPVDLTLHVFKDGPPAETIAGALQLVIE